MSQSNTLTPRDREQLSILINQLCEDEETSYSQVSKAVSFYCRFLRFNPDLVVRAMAEVSGLRDGEIKGKSREPYIIRARFACVHYLYAQGAQVGDITEYFGQNSKGSVIHARDEFARLLKEDETAQELYSEFEKMLNEIKD